MVVCWGFLVGSVLNSPVAAVLSATLIRQFFPSYTSFVVGPSFGGVFSSTSVLPLFTNETVNHVPPSLSRSPLGGSSLLGPSAAISAPVVKIRKHTPFM